MAMKQWEYNEKLAMFMFQVGWSIGLSGFFCLFACLSQVPRLSPPGTYVSAMSDAFDKQNKYASTGRAWPLKHQDCGFDSQGHPNTQKHMHD